MKIVKILIGGSIIIGMPMYLLGVTSTILFIIFITGIYLFIDGFTS